MQINVTIIAYKLKFWNIKLTLICKKAILKAQIFITMKVKQLLEELSEFSPTLLYGNPNWEVERIVDEWLPFYDEGAVYVENFVRCSAFQNSATVIVSDSSLAFLSPMAINVILVPAVDLDKVKERISVLLN